LRDRAGRAVATVVAGLLAEVASAPPDARMVVVTIAEVEPAD
jgi:hypothetical protein